MYEPFSALFVPDNNPLIYYHSIAKFAQKNLSSNGKLFFEINEYLYSELIELLKNIGFKNINLRHDINGKKSMLKISNS